MVEYSSYEPGTPCWVDLMTPDLEGAKAFYGALFGWEPVESLDDDGSLIYINFTRDGKVVAGLGQQDPSMAGAPAIWSTYIAVADASATQAAVAAAGGTVVMPAMEVMEFGSMAVFADPTGAVFGVWQPGSHIGAQLVNEDGTWSWNELMTRDVEAAKAFYGEVFGWTYDPQDMGPMGTYHVIEGGDHGGLGGLMAMPPGLPEQVPNHWAVYFSVDDLDATVKTATENGGQVVQEPVSAPGVGTFATLHDPAGGSFAVLQPESAGS